MSGLRRRLPVLTSLALRSWVAAVALAALPLQGAVTFVEYPLPNDAAAPKDPTRITAGPDGALWFTEMNVDRIGRITTNGVVTEFPVSAGAGPLKITVGPDGNLWFTEYSGNAIGRMTPSGVLTEFPVPSHGGTPPRPWGITTGPDGNLWFTESQWDISFPEFNRIGRMAIDGTLTEYALPNLVPGPHGITVGPDGRLWFCEWYKMAIGAIDPVSFLIQSWELPKTTRLPLEIVTGSDGNLWFTEPDQHGPAEFIGTITTTGVITELQLPTSNIPPEDLVVGPDGYIWFTIPGTSEIGRVANGSFTFYTVPTTPARPLPAPLPDPAEPVGITLGPDGNIWFTDIGGYHVGAIRKLILNGPSVTSITPNSGPSIGGTAVTIIGSNFQNGATVTLGGVPATVATVSPSSIAATTGPHASGAVDVVVTNPDGGAGTLAGGFTYTPCGGTAPTATLSGTTTICAGQPATLSVALTGTPPWKLIWSDGLTETGIGSGTWSRAVSPTTSTSYTILAVADASCGGSGTGSADVTVNTTPSAGISAPTVVCMGSPYTASVPDGGAGVTYAWTLSNGTITSGTGTRSITFSASAPGPMVLSVTVANGTCSASSSANITAYARATVAVSGNATVCSGQTATISLVLTGLSPWYVTWSDGITQIYSTSPGSRQVTPLSTTTYTATQVVDGTGCAGTTSGSADITVNPTPSAVITAQSTTCPNSTANVASVPLASGATYTWTIAGGTITAGAGTNSITYTAGASGTVTLDATVVANGCTATSSLTVTIRTLPTATLSGTATICAGAPANLSVDLTGTPPWRVTWSDGTVQTTSSTPLTRTVTPAANTTYTLASVSDASCTGSVSGSAVLTLTPSPTADVSGSATVCSGDSAVITAVITGAPPISLQWSDGVLMTGLAPGVVTRTVTPVLSTSYQVDAVTDATCSARGTGGAFVIVAPDPLASVIQAPLVLCTGATAVHATVPDSGPDATYTWTITNGTITAGDATNDITFSAGDTAGPLLISVKVSLPSGCWVSGSTTLTVTSAPAPPSISGPASAATGQPGLVALVPSHPGASYSWTIENGTITGGAGTSQITFTSGLPGATTLHVTETSMQGCRSETATLVIPIAGLSLSRVVPIVLDVTGLGGARFTSELTLANPGPAPASVDITFTAADALSSSGSGTVPETIPAGRQLVIADAVAYLREKGLAIPAGGGQGGTLGVTFRNLAIESAPYAAARTTAPSGNGRAGLAYAAPRLDQVSADVVQLFGLRQTSADRSNLALENAGTGGAVTLRVTLHSGAAGDTRKVVLPDVTLAAGQWTQLNEVLASAGLTNGWAQVERVSGTDPFLAYAVFNDNTTNDGSFVPAIATTRPVGPQVLPVLVETGAFTSELVLANPGTKPIDVSLSFIESLAHPAGAFTGTVRLALQPGEQQIIADAVDWMRGKGATIGTRGPAYAGALSVQFASGGAMTGGFVGARTAAPAPGGGRYGLFYTGSLASEAAMNAAWVFGLAQDAASRSNLALVNGAATQGPVTVKYEVYDGATGQKAGESAPITIGPGGWTQIDAVLAKYGVTNGYVKIVKTAGTPGFVAYGVVNDGATPSAGTSDGSYVPMTIVP